MLHYYYLMGKGAVPHFQHLVSHSRVHVYSVCDFVCFHVFCFVQTSLCFHVFCVVQTSKLDKAYELKPEIV